VGVQIRSREDLDRVVRELRLPESDSLDYKETVPLGTAADRRELLKDLSGMANGGSGTVAFGVSKDQANPELPSQVIPLADRGLVGRLEDIVRDGIRPPLLIDLRMIDYPPGFVLVAEVTRSPLGPYMVEAGGDRRYYVRQGSRTAPMGEQQVRDLYMLAARARENRPALWASHHLPIPPMTADNAWLVLSGLPEEPLVDLADPSILPPQRLRPPNELDEFRDAARASGIFDDLKVWADGYFAEVAIEWSRRAFRLHRDGAVGWATEVAGRLGAWFPRVLHAQLLHLAWLWALLDVRTPIEFRIDIVNLEAATMILPGWFDESRTPERPHGIGGRLDATHSSVILPADLNRASFRHRLVRGVDARLRNAFGVPWKRLVMFQIGWLLGREGRSLGLFLARNGIFRSNGDILARIDERGRVENVRTAETVAFVDGGVVLDPEGNAVAAVEFAVGTGLPDEFLAREFPDPTRAPAGASDTPNPAVDAGPVLPSPTKRWSERDLPSVLA
jgi:hypothetical protein